MVMRKCDSVSRIPIDENNDSVSKSWIVYRHAVFTAAEDLATEDLAIFFRRIVNFHHNSEA